MSTLKEITWMPACLSFIFCYCINLLKLTRYGDIVNNVMNKSNFNFVMGYTGYYLLGYYLHRYEISKKFNNVINVLAIISIAITIVFSSLHSIHFGEPRQDLYGYLLPNTFFVSVAVFLLFKNKFSKIQLKEKTSRFISKLSSLTFGMYLVHDFFNMLLRQIGLTTLTFNPVFSVPIIAMIVFLSSMVVAYGISKIPVLKKYIM